MATRLRPSQSVVDALESVQFVVGKDGQQTGVLMDMADWEALLDWLEDLEDRALVQFLLPNLRLGPEKAAAMPWEEAEAKWNDE